MTRLARHLCLAVAVLATAATSGAAAHAHPSDRRDRPDHPRDRFPGHTIVEVEGDAANGFSVFRLDGTSEHPPTLSESTAECEEYDSPTRVAVCVAEVETRFADLADLQLSLRWAQRHRGGR